MEYENVTQKVSFINAEFILMLIKYFELHCHIP
jgi:phosphate starvation-inducible membrane PsiE